ncbi:MAG: alpha-D-ribose 1-methylphosphonate 5-triphosphate diphosphatase [Cyanobacteria bacterium P01_H01_bin.162]
MTEQVYTNYRLQLPDQEVVGTLTVRDGLIADIQPGVVAQGQDGDGQYLLPGLVELHTDNFEQRLAPRPKVKWPIALAAVYHDRDLAAAGITTVCDAIAVGDITATSMRMTQFDPMIRAIHEGQLAGRLAVDHRLHLRCELGYNQVHEVTATYADHPLLALISLMDHTPGQRQFVQIDKYKEYYQGKHGVTAEAMDDFIRDRITAQQHHAADNRRALVELAAKHQICLASHDDATPEHVHEAVQDGAKIAEFPTTLAAAKAAHSQGLQVLMGSPNLILGGSHSGNVSAMELIAAGLVDIISSDYVPQSLLQAMFTIAQQQAQPLYEVMRLFTINPAQAIGLAGDRGSLAICKRADLVALQHDGVAPRVTSVWRQGQRVA